jgi:hypothetical protein|tara:strand:+ start:312 stop:1028 length:717 start_codon:yes stop_codon:yes gene_type:complete
MKIAKSQLRKIIKEELTIVLESLGATSGEDFTSAMSDLGALYQPVAVDAEEDAQYANIETIIDKMAEYELEKIRISKKALKDALYAYDDAEALHNQLIDTIRPMVEDNPRPDGYRWEEIWTRMLVEILGLKKAWSKRPMPGPKVKRGINKLMKSKLFANASDKDKAAASKKIFKALMSLESNGGYEMYYEEMLDDALGGYDSPLIRRLAKAAGSDSESWGEALGAWSDGDRKFERWMR